MTASAEKTIMALHTYGAQRVTDPRTRQPVSAYKMGSTDATAPVLLHYFGGKAHDVSSPKASYRYIKLDNPVIVRHGYLVLEIPAVELLPIENITRQHFRPATYRWRDGQWWEFPNQRSAEYSEIFGRSAPSFNPTGLFGNADQPDGQSTGVVIERVQYDPNKPPWWWVSGETYPHRELLKRQGARFSGRRKAWYYVGWELPDALKQLASTEPTDEAISTPAENHFSAPSPPTHDPCTLEEAAAILGLPLKPNGPSVNPFWQARQTGLEADMAEFLEQEEPPELSLPEVVPNIYHQPSLSPPDSAKLDAIETAIQTVKSQDFRRPMPSTVPRKKTLTTIGQQFVGELTGSVSGHVHCYGYAVHEGVMVYVNMGGPRMAVEAIRAKLAKGEIVTVVPWDAPAVELTAGEDNTGMYTDFMQHIPEAKFTSLILVHEWVVNPNYGGKSTTFIVQTSDEQAMAKLKCHIYELVKVPVFDEWANYLWSAGQAAMLVRSTRSAGEINLWSVDLDIDAWTRLLTGGLEQGIICLPMAAS